MYVNTNLDEVPANKGITTAAGKTYGRDWDKDDLVTKGELFKVTETQRPEDTDEAMVTGYSIDETYTQVWETRPKTQDELDEDMLTARKDALAAEWPDAFAFVDEMQKDMVAAGINLPCFDKRDAIKASKPKPNGGN